MCHGNFNEKFKLVKYSKNHNSNSQFHQTYVFLSPNSKVVFVRTHNYLITERNYSHISISFFGLLWTPPQISEISFCYFAVEVMERRQEKRPSESNTSSLEIIGNWKPPYQQIWQFIFILNQLIKENFTYLLLDILCNKYDVDIISLPH